MNGLFFVYPVRDKILVERFNGLFIPLGIRYW